MKAAPFVRLALWTLVAAFVLWPDLFAPLLRPLAPDGMPVIYDRARLADLTLWHLGLVVAAIIPSALLATALTGQWIYRRNRAREAAADGARR